jgi:diguanylate cyclase (GGDEF)-like protein
MARGDGRKGLARLISRSFAVVGGGLAALFAVAGLLFAVGQLGVQPRLQRDQDAQEALSAATAGMLDQETGLRAYVVTRDPVFLQPYVAGSSAVTVGDTQAAAELGAGNVATAQLLRVEVAQRQWETSWASPARDAPSQHGGTRLLPFLAQGMALFDRYRSVETRLESMVRAQVRSTEANEQSLLVGEGLLIGVSLAVLAIALWGERRRLTHAVAPPISRLQAMMRDIEAGTAATLTPLATGPAELVELSSGLVRMAGALEAERRASASSEARVLARARQLTQVLEVARDVSGNLNLRYVLDAVARGAGALAARQQVAIWLVEDDGVERAHMAGVNAASAPCNDEGPLGLPLPAGPALLVGPDLALGAGSAREAIRYGRIVRRAPGGGPDEQAELAIPMIVGARVVGAIVVSGAEGLPEGGEASLDMLATHAATAVEAARLHLAVQDQARADALTHLANRRQLDDDLAAECSRSSRYGRPLSFIMADVDHFKKINDTYGHQAGDAILQELAQVVSGALRTSDGAYRYGGEEFAVILPETALEEAARLAERLRKAVEAHFAPSARAVTASFGVADDVVAGGADPALLVAASDGALYEAKRSGRNQVAAARPASDLSRPCSTGVAPGCWVQE